MGIVNGQDFRWLYDDYLRWFRENAVDGAQPVGEEEILSNLWRSEDEYEDGEITLNRCYFLVQLLPSESGSGRIECFAFSELNLILRQDTPAGLDVTKIVPVEYRRE